jgi:hypothetical protein
MVKLVDTPASGAGDRKVVEVRVFFWAPIQTKPSPALGFVFSAFEILDQTVKAATETGTEGRATHTLLLQNH